MVHLWRLFWWLIVAIRRRDLVHYNHWYSDWFTMFQISGIELLPFKKRVVYSDSGVSLVVNIIWLIISGLPLAIGHCISGLLLCLTIIGIPFGQQSFKLAKLALMPFGAVLFQQMIFILNSQRFLIDK